VKGGQRSRSLPSWAPYALAALLILVFFHPLVFGKVFLSPDSVAPAGFAKYAMDVLQTKHVYALWNPYHFLGMPTFGSLAFVPYVYPLDAVFGFLNVDLHFPDLTWLLVHYLLIAIAMVALLKSLGVGGDAAVLGAATFALTPNLVAVGAFGHGSQIMTAAWLPVLLLLFDRFARRGSLLALAGFALAAALQLLRGHVQIVFYSWMAIGLYALFLAVQAARSPRPEERAGLWRPLAGLVVGLGLGFGISAFLYLPVHEYAKLSIRSAGEGSGAGFEYATSWSFHPAEMLTFLIPSMFGFGGQTYWGTMPFTDYPNYMGIIPLALAIYGAKRARNGMRVYWITLAGFALLIAFGKHLKPLYSLLYSYLPYFNKFRVPVMILVLVQLAVAALAALGLEAALRAPEGSPSSSAAKGPATGRARAKAKSGEDPGALWMRAAIFAGAGAVGVVVLLQLLGPSLTAIASKAREYMNPNLARTALDMATVDTLKSGIILAAGFAVIAFQRRGKLSRTAAVLLIVGLTAADLWVVDRKIIDPMLGSKNQYADNFTETPEITFLKKDPTEFRVLPLRFDDSRLAAFGIASVLGYHPAKPRLYQAFMDTVGIPNFRILRLLNVKYVLTDGYFPDTTTTVALRHDGPVKAYEVKGTLPRAFVVHRLHPTMDNSTALAFLRTATFFDPSAEALWTDPPPYPTFSEPATPDSVTRIRYGMNESEYMVATAAPGLFVQVDQYDPDWTATIDGKPAAIHRVNYLMRGIEIPAGVHRVRLAYRPAALTAGLRLTAASLGATVLLGLAGLWQLWRRRKRSRAAATPAATESAE
jgi:hypothetical protein